MEFTELERHLGAGKFARMYLALGPEPFLRAEALRLIRSSVEAATKGIDVAEHDALEIDPVKLFEDIQVPSLFAPARLVIVENAGALFTQSLSLLSQYVAHPSPKTVLVLSAEELGKTKSRRRKKSTAKDKPSPKQQDAAAVLEHMTVIQCPAINAYALANWCAQRANRYGKTMPRDAANTLVELAGTNLGQLDGQIQSLAAYCDTRSRITVEDVSKLVGGDHARRLWDLVDAVNNGNAVTALKIADRHFRESGGGGIVIISAIATDVMRLAKVRRLMDLRVPRQEIGARARVYVPWLVDKIINVAQKFTSAELRRRLNVLLKADLALKSGGGDEQIIVERVIMDFCGTGGQMPVRRPSLSSR